MPTCKHFDFEALRQLEYQPGLEATVATHHLKLYHLVAAMQAPTVMEFGVDKGRSTCMFLHACEAVGGHLYSVDVVDCSGVAESEAWTFIQSSDQARDTIIAAAPAVAEGIDLLHIDSLHARDHVRDLLLLWYPYVKAGGYITFHDVDPTPYLKSQRKDNPKHEREAIGMATVIREFFYANANQLYLEYHFGSTGMGIMRKLSPLHTVPNPPVPIRSREIALSWDGLFWTARNSLSRLVRRLR
ncbi:MAG: class I SAM-dependent methyltransferase [Chloroflexi bacterium]|nr:class I SAM-dependent methyltransferase [Chloroflexota bacterium]